MTQFDGYVTRQGLVDFCRAKVTEAQGQSKEIEKALDHNLSDADKQVLNEAYSANLGFQKAMRAVTEFAEQTKVQTPEGTDSGDGRR